ncbi:GRF1-interacting factor 1 isoform X1 [Raphanus sativus]|uniref:GRF1-interacting factor 1 isoform X1 n=1 Tax=Raphanus sativus TaxID=3726 RepID=A0A6J0JPA9_RAPSA|nr:GRF1-interacting factor 1 isoform X1 [Raphanus sativus]XP_056844641.1 GRF1-interacting factor 1 isoform X1 [Raphanus sativus]
MQQHLMQMQPMMAGYYPSNVTSDHIQQYLDENKSLILKIVESQNSGKLSECAENQARLQRNLMYLAAIADSQPQPPSMHSQQYGSGGGGLVQGEGGSHYLQQQQATQHQQQMTQQSLMAARTSSMMYAQQQQQQPYATLQHHQLHHSQLGMSSTSGGGSSGLHLLQGEAGGFHEFGRGKLEMGSGEGRGGSSGDGGETLYLKSSDDGN